MRKILNIAWKDLYTVYTDRNLMVIMIVTPLALATIISLAFSQFFGGSGNDVPIRDIPIAIVNLDEGVETNGTTINNGEIFINVLVPPADANETTLNDNPLYQLTNAVVVDSPETARAGVDDGTYSAAVIIPANFSSGLTFTQDNPELAGSSIDVYASSAAPVGASVTRSIVESISNQIVTGNITVASTINALIQRAQTDPAFGLQFGLSSAAGGFNPDFSPAFSGGSLPITIEQQTVTGEAVALNPLVAFGASLTVFFMLFTANGSAISLLEEQRDGTLQRLIVSPTSRMAILLGKLLGTFVNCLFQVIVLMLALTLVASLIGGELQLIWGSNLPLIVLSIVAIAFGGTGLGALVASMVKTPDQGNAIGGVITMAMGVLGGAFFNISAIPALAPLSRLTVVYWGSDAMQRLSLGQTDIGTNLLVLLGLGAVMFSVSVILFTRRLNV
jgi:ABC-2 type transport system permease protein